jgi:hypothetical protein
MEQEINLSNTNTTSLLCDVNAVVTMEVFMFTVLAAVNNDAVFQITVNILNTSENRCQGVFFPSMSVFMLHAVFIL